MSFLVCCLVAAWIYTDTSQAQQHHFNRGEGSSCFLANGRRGICRVITGCPSALASIQFEQPVNCGFRGHTPIVCCKDGTTDVKPVQNIGTVTRKPTTSARARAEEKCREYSRSVTYVADVLPLLPGGMPSSIETAKCDFGDLPLIVGGEKTKPGEFPHMAALAYKSGRGVTWLCGGSLISDFYVMTAAHCVSTRLGPPVLVRLGELNLKENNDGAHPQDYTIQSVMTHPSYGPSSKYNDIGLIRLSQKVKFTEAIRPACLFPDQNIYVNKTVATGWGTIGSGLDASSTLLKVGLDIIGNDLCDKLYNSLKGTSQLSHGIDSTMLCAGVLKGGKDTCQGDSGGPLQIVSQHNKCIYYVIGITSFGKFCAAANAPGVYTRVSQFLPWVVSVVWP